MLETKKSRGTHGVDIHSAGTKQRARRGQSRNLGGTYTELHKKVGDGRVSGGWDTTRFRGWLGFDKADSEVGARIERRGCVLYIDDETI